MKISKLAIFSFSIALFLSSCTKEEAPKDVPLGTYDNGVLILNQGGFGSSNASISYLSRDFITFQNDVFDVVNPSDVLGDVAQDLAFNGQFAYIVLNGSNKIEIVNRYTMQRIGAITTGLSNPRYMAFANGNAYVTNWGAGSSPSDDYVAVINLLTNAVTATIPVVEGPEKIVAENNNLYVAHAGGYGYGNSISVINSVTNTVTTSIPVGDVPNSMMESNGILVVSCGGKPSYAPTETGGKLVKINLLNNAIVSTINFGPTSHPQNLTIDNNLIYYTMDASIYSTTLASTVLPTTPLFNVPPQGAYGIYSFEVENNTIYIGDAVDYSANGKIYLYSLSGTLLREHTVGVIPAGFYFNL